MKLIEKLSNMIEELFIKDYDCKYSITNPNRSYYIVIIKCFDLFGYDIRAEFHSIKGKLELTAEYLIVPHQYMHRLYDNEDSEPFLKKYNEWIIKCPKCKTYNLFSENSRYKGSQPEVLGMFACKDRICNMWFREIPYEQRFHYLNEIGIEMEAHPINKHRTWIGKYEKETFDHESWQFAEFYKNYYENKDLNNIVEFSFESDGKKKVWEHFNKMKNDENLNKETQNYQNRIYPKIKKELDL